MQDLKKLKKPNKPKPLNQLKELKEIKEPAILLIRKAPRGISRRIGRIGIFAASFNPPTMAHLALIRQARKRFDLDENLVLLDIKAMDKRIVGASLEDRLMMLKVLFRRDPKISIGLSNRGRFVEKLLPLRTLYPPPISFVFIVGFDTILRVMDKKYYKDRDDALGHLFEASQFLVANRGGHDAQSFEALFEKTANRKYRDDVSFFMLPEGFSSLSSNLIRRKIAAGLPVEGLVPVSILRYIQRAGLYDDR
jgi:nicotinate (nicotinamide) nucleotide adenylyltransferase